MKGFFAILLIALFTVALTEAATQAAATEAVAPTKCCVNCHNTPGFVKRLETTCKRKKVNNGMCRTCCLSTYLCDPQHKCKLQYRYCNQPVCFQHKTFTKCKKGIKKGKCVASICCSFRRICKKNKCRTKKLSCKRQGKLACQPTTRITKHTKCTNNKTSRCNTRRCCLIQTTCVGKKCASTQLSCNVQKKCKNVSVKITGKCKVTKKGKNCKTTRCCRFQIKCVNGNCKTNSLGCNIVTGCKKGPQPPKIFRTTKCKTKQTLRNATEKCSVRTCCQFEKICFGARCTRRKVGCNAVKNCNTYRERKSYKCKKKQNKMSFWRMLYLFNKMC